MGKHATQTVYPWRATARTVVQAFVGFCALFPAIYAAATQGDPLAATGYAAAGLAFTGAVTRVMAIPGFDAWLKRYLSFLASEPRAAAPEAAVIADIPAAGEAAE